LGRLIIPDSVITIGSSAFDGCGLESVIIGRNVKTIEKYAFNNNKLTELIIPESVTCIGMKAFSRNQLANITFPNDNIYIGEKAFAENKLKSVIVPKGTTFVSSGAFFDNPLTSVTLPNGITAIESGAFQDCKLTSITIPEGVKYIGKNSFKGNQLKSLIIPDSVIIIEHQAFDTNNLTSLTLGKGLEKMESWAFGDNNLTEVVFPPNARHDDSFAITPAGKQKGKTQPKITGYNPKGQLPPVPEYPPRSEFLRQLDNALNCGIAPATDTSETAPPKKTPRKEDIFFMYSESTGKNPEVPPDRNMRWQYSFGEAHVASWKSSDFAKEAEVKYKSQSKKCSRIGSITCCGNTKPFKRAQEIMNLSKDEVIAQYRKISSVEKRTSYTVKEVKPAGNWLWELEVENQRYFGVIIGWPSMADADKAEEVYKSMPEIRYRRYGNAICYTRASDDVGVNVFLPFGDAAKGSHGKEKKDE